MIKQLQKYFILVCLLVSTYTVQAQELVSEQTDSIQIDTLQREFRGVWVHTVFNQTYQKMDSTLWHQHMCKELDEYEKMGMNALVFQIRPEGDAFYQSPHEPWSRFLTGTQGLAPDTLFDPMEILITECHKRGMEFHAWLNPYRANANKRNKLSPDHIYFKKRYLFISYGNQLYFNPGRPENREYVCKIVKDIVSRYNVDAIHMDDYFYPYPRKGIKFPDKETFKRFGIKSGKFEADEIDEWRRNNINLLIEELHDTIQATKPEVRFGISPFGIYRNIAQDSINGSETKGLSNYDDLYADVLLWAENGWIDYLAPQLYWEIGHKYADYTTLLDWWEQHIGENETQLYIGQDVRRSHASQLKQKMDQMKSKKRIHGNIFWNGNELLENSGGIADSLKQVYHKKDAAPPTFAASEQSNNNSTTLNLRFDLMGSEPILLWDDRDSSSTRTYGVYAFDTDEEVNLLDSSKLLGFTGKRTMKLPISANALCLKYVITTFDARYRESYASKALKYND